MIPVAEARARILSALTLAPIEHISLEHALGRVLAYDVTAARTQPPSDLSAMDGYAVRADDTLPGRPALKMIGESAAGHRFEGTVQPGETVRIFTGAPLPEGADAILVQEDARTNGVEITALEAVSTGTYIRKAGLDFRTGETGLQAGTLLSPRHVGLLAAMNVPWVAVRRKPRIALLSTGDELVRPGEMVGRDQIISSNALSVAGIVRLAGGEPVDIGIAPDRSDALAECAANAIGADMLVTLGGASVGDHDLVQEVLGSKGMALDFWRIAMRPGKPLMFGKFGDMPLLGLPGNPVSSLVCGLIFLRPAILGMLGIKNTAPTVQNGILGSEMGYNDQREDYVRSRLQPNANGQPTLLPFPKQDSSMLSVMSEAHALVIRAPHAQAIAAGEPIEYIALDGVA